MDIKEELMHVLNAVDNVARNLCDEHDQESVVIKALIKKAKSLADKLEEPSDEIGF